MKLTQKKNPPADDDIVATEEVATVVTGAVDTGSPSIAGIDEVEGVAISPLPILKLSCPFLAIF